jgi:hypothetical protein
VLACLCSFGGRGELVAVLADDLAQDTEF